MPGRSRVFYVLVLVGISGCGASAQPVAMTTVTVTSAPSSAPGDAGAGVESQGTPTYTERENVAEEDMSLPFGILLSNAEMICTTPTNALPVLAEVGDSPQFTEAIQIVALDLGYEVGDVGVYDAKTVEAVKGLQSYLDMEPNGQVGAVTWNALHDQYCPEFREFFSDGYSEGESETGGQSGGDVSGGSPAPQAPQVSPPFPGPQPVTMPKVGSMCPMGYLNGFDTCDPGPTARYAYISTGISCPLGYRSEWEYCVME